MSEKKQLLHELLSLRLQARSGRLSKVHLIGEKKKKLRTLKVEAKR
jgi:ribosomal protein L29